MKNKVLLIGMPGCGKTTISKMLSDALNLPVVDMDSYIEDSTGKRITELFQKGEEHFRSIETLACETLSKKEQLIIASGGGIVKNPLNISYFDESSLILFLDRPVEQIEKDIEISHRPLLKSGKSKLQELYEERYDLYKKYSHHRIDNSGDIHSTVKAILDIITLNNKAIKIKEADCI